MMDKGRHSQPAVSIRSLQPGDVGYVAYLHSKIYNKKYKFDYSFEYYVMKGLAEFINHTYEGELWVAEIDNEIVGSIAITKASDTSAQLRWFIVDETVQGRGIGKKLLEKALQYCKAKNFRHVFLWTVNRLETARYLYQKYHFKLTEEKSNTEWSDGELMEERWDLELTDLE